MVGTATVLVLAVQRMARRLTERMARCPRARAQRPSTGIRMDSTVQGFAGSIIIRT